MRLIMMSMVLLLVSSAWARPSTTIIAHGFSPGSKGVWVQGMAEAILARAGEGSLYRYQGATGRWTFVPTTNGDGTNDVVVLIFNWVPESDGPDAGPNWNYVQAAADVLYAMLRDPKYAAASNPPANLLLNRAVHFIGHSRGACVVSEAIKRLALANIAVDQFTAHDPHPVNGTQDSPYDFDWGDPVPQKWSNVVWADNYWRADGGGFINGLDFDGIPLANVFNVQLSESALNCCAYSYSHSDVHLWYHGTIDTGANACDGEQCITPTMRSTWWPGPGGFVQSGFYYTALGGGSAQRPVLAAGIEPEPVETIYNGGFEQGTRAGWTFHGGSVSGQIVSEGGNWYARIGAGQGGSAITHNRFHVPVNASAIGFDYRVTTAAANESLEIVLTESFGPSYVVGAVSAMPAGNWIIDQSLPIGCAIPRGRTYTLTLRLAAPAAVSAVIGLDNVRLITQGQSVPGDATGDGLVNVNDLLAVVNAWGPCPPPCKPSGGSDGCPADVTGDCLVNVNDLLLVINAWGSCL